MYKIIKALINTLLSVSHYMSSRKSFAVHFSFLILFTTFYILAFLTLKGKFPIDNTFSFPLKADKCSSMHTDEN